MAARARAAPRHAYPQFAGARGGLADCSQVTMTAPFMRAYALTLVKTCHKRGAPAMGGMAAQIPIKNDLVANDAAMEQVRADKLREVTDGCDGTWVAHPGLVCTGDYNEFLTLPAYELID